MRLERVYRSGRSPRFPGIVDNGPAPFVPVHQTQEIHREEQNLRGAVHAVRTVCKRSGPDQGCYSARRFNADQ